MNSIQRKANKLANTVCLLAVCSSLLLACGDSTDGSDTVAGIGGTGIVAGKITAFGSIYVNGGKFDIDTSTFMVDGKSFVGRAGQDALALGMVVQLRVGTENGVFTNTALEVVYDDEIEGPIANIALPDPTTKTGTIFGQTITFDKTSTVFEAAPAKPDFDFGSLGNNQVVEISGFRVSATEITASYVRFVENLNLGSSEVELRGTISNYMPGLPETFKIDGVTITTDVNTEIEVPNGMLVDGIYVEVEGVIQNATLVLADKIEFEDEDFDDDVDEISLQGVVAGFSGNINDDFFIDSQLVNASTAQLAPAGLTLVNGLNVEVEGKIIGGKLIADKIELREGESKLRSTIGAVDAANESFKVMYPTAIPNEVTVRVDGQTLFEDETGAALVTIPFSLDDLNPLVDFVRIEGQEVNGEVVASVVKRVDGAGQKLKLEGAVDTFAANSSITILGITYDVDPTPGTGTDFGGFANSADFFAALNPAGGDLVEIEDDDVADGIADEVELE